MNSSHPDDSSTSSLSRLVSLLAIAFLLTLPRLVNEDSQRRIEALDHILGAGSIPTTKYSVIGPLFATPLWFAGPAAVESANRILALVAAAGLWWSLRPVLTASVARRFLLLLAFTSMLPNHLLFFGGEVFTTAAIGVGSAMVVVRQSAWGYPLLALGAANTAATIPGLALAMAVLIGHDRRLRHLLPVAAAVGLVLLENAIRRGDPFAGGYDGEHGHPNPLPYSARPGFSYPILFGVLSILLSFGKGLVWFTPGLFVPLDQHDRDGRLRVLYRVWIAFVVGLMLVYASWWSWYGGYFWGPRFFLFACLPASLVLACRSTPPVQGSLGMNLIVFAVLVLSCWVGVNGVVYQQYGVEAYLADDYRLEFVLWYVPECSPLWWPWVHPKPLDTADAMRLVLLAAGAAYLLAPLAGTIARQMRSALLAAWARVRSGPRLRF